MTRRTHLTHLAAAAVLVLAFAAPAQAETFSGETPAASADSLKQLTAFLDSTSFVASRLELRDIDTDPVPELITIATAPRTRAQVRERAIQCLSMFRDARVREAFKGMLDHNKGDKTFGLIALSYLEAFGEDAVDDLKPFLEHKKPEVRAVVAKGFGMFGGQKGYDLLREHNRVESDARVLEAMRPFVQ